MKGLYKELLERREYLVKRGDSKERLEELNLAIVRVQEILLDVLSKEIVSKTKDIDSKFSDIVTNEFFDLI